MKLRGFRITSAALAGALLAQSLPALAQSTQSSTSEAISSFEQAQQARRSLDFGALCLIRKRGSSVRHFLRLYTHSEDAQKMSLNLVKGECVDGSAGRVELTFTPAILRGVLYKALYIRDFRENPQPISGSSIDWQNDAGQMSTTEARTYASDRKFAECLVRKDSEAARAMVVADAESEDETAARLKLQPYLDQCMVDGKVELNRAKLTGLVAEALYRLTTPATAMRMESSLHA